MMGLLGNVAEVPELRPQLMTPNFVAEFKMLLESTSDGIEVPSSCFKPIKKLSYNFSFNFRSVIMLLGS